MVDSRKTGFNGRRTFFGTEAEALAEAEQIARDKENHGALAFVELGASQRKDAAEAIGILAEFDASLVNAARHYAAVLRAKLANESALSVEDCIEQYLEAKRADQTRGALRIEVKNADCWEGVRRQEDYRS
jgi:hypothetical protein